MTDRAPSNRPTAAEARDDLSRLLDTAAVATDATDVDQPAPGEAVTRPLDAVGGGTTVMPVALVPDEGSEPVPDVEPRGRRWAVIAAVVGVVALLLTVTSLAGGDGVELPPSTTVTEPVVTEPSSTTTVATTTTAPPADKKRGKGNGGGHGDGDD